MTAADVGPSVSGSSSEPVVPGEGAASDAPRWYAIIVGREPGVFRGA